MNNKLISVIVFGIVIGLLWLVFWGDFAEWRYSKNLHCDRLDHARQQEICNSIERYQVHELFGHAMISAGYRSTFVTAKYAWCALALREQDLTLLDELQYPITEISPQLQAGAGMLHDLLDAQLHPDAHLYVGSVYDPTSPYFLVKEGCPKE